MSLHCTAIQFNITISSPHFQLIKLFVVIAESYSHTSEDDLLILLKDHAEEMLLEKHRPSQVHISQPLLLLLLYLVL